MKYISLGDEVSRLGIPAATIVNGIWQGPSTSPALHSAKALAKQQNAKVFIDKGVFLMNDVFLWENGDPGIVGYSRKDSRLIPGAATSNQAFFQVVDSTGLDFRDFGIGDIAMPGRPSTAIHFAETAAGRNSSSEHILDSLKIDGYYTKGATVFSAFASSQVRNCIFHNKYNASDVATVWFDQQGLAGLYSSYGKTYQYNGAVSDLHFSGTEIHSTRDGLGYTNSNAIIFDGGGDIHFSKGIIGSCGFASCLFRGFVSDISFAGTAFFGSDTGYCSQKLLHANNGTAVMGLSIHAGSGACEQAFLSAGNSAAFHDVTVSGFNMRNGWQGGNPAFLSQGSSGYFRGVYDCQFRNVNSAGQVQGVMMRPGALNIVENSAKIL